MPYDSEKDEYTCPNGKKLRAVHEKIRKSKSGFESLSAFYVKAVRAARSKAALSADIR